MESQTVVKKCKEKMNLPVDFDVDFSIISGESFEKIRLFAKQKQLGLNAVLISVLAALIYRYQNEEQYNVKLQYCKKKEFDNLKTIQLDISKKSTLNSIVIDFKKISVIDKDLDNLTSIFCSSESEESDSLIIKTLFERSVNGSVIVNVIESEKSESFRRWHEHFCVLLESMVSKPNESITNIEILSEKELLQLQKMSVSLVNPIISNPECLQELFEKTVVKFPDKPVLRCKGKEISYEEFNKKSNSLARLLRSYGVKKGTHVAILLPRSEMVFVAIMGVLKSGAAYVPIDPRSPVDRIKFILEDADVNMVITDHDLKEQNNLPDNCLCIEDLPEKAKNFTDKDIASKETGITPDDQAYIIYTSGTTGKPKGVVLLHKTVCNLIRGESEIFKVNEKDRVYQGFSVSFDASVEEMWLAWYSGAVLVAATKSEALSGPDLVKFFEAEKITVFSTVPTQISMMQKPVDSVRILILGGEECHLKAIEPWFSHNRKIFNTYGPTEATVIATYGECLKGIKPSIGKPAPNYAVFILDRNLKKVPVGMTGELCIGGHCLANGYLNRQELTSQKFITPDFEVGNDFPQRLYRSGDRASFAPDGSIKFCGRIDDQVKLRGQRIELGEIEAAIVKTASASQVAVALCTNAQGIQSLVAYVTNSEGKNFDEKEVKNSLKNFLPSYMIPGQFCVLDNLPVLPSGKVDRKKLVSMKIEDKKSDREIVEPKNDCEAKILEIWQKYFDRKDISIKDDFFDIGGHSLLAATIVSELRNLQGMKDLPLQYIYQFRTIEALSAVLEKEYLAGKETAVNENNETESKEPESKSLAHIVCGIFQSIALYPIFMLFSMPMIIPFIIDWFNPDIELLAWVIASFSAMLLLFPTVVLISIVGKWIIIGRFKAGTYPLWGGYYFKFWLVCKLMDLVPTRVMRGTPFLTWYYRLLGARIGRNVHMGSDRFRICDMVSIGNNVSINSDAHIMAYKVSNGQLHIGPVVIGKNCTIGTRSVISENSGMMDYSELGELSLLPSGETIGNGEYWEGSPAQKVENTVVLNNKEFDYSASLRSTISYKIEFTLAFLFVLIMPIILLIPWIIVAFLAYVNYGMVYTLPFTIPLAALYVVSFCLTVAIVKRVIAPSDIVSSYPVYSKEYIRKWVVDALVQLSLMTIQPLYATVYLPFWLRMLGAKIGKRAEISTVDHITADLLSVEEGSFVADSASVGPAVVRDGKVHVARTVVGKRSFIGNSALIPMGTSIGDNCLVGVLSRPPIECKNMAINDTNWLGSPPMILPKRQQSQKFEDKLTYEPPVHMVILRGVVEFFKITMPPALTSCCYIFSYWFVSEILGPIASLVSYVLMCPVIIFGSSLSVTLLTVLLKWALVGRYHQIQKPLWSLFIWKNEFVNSLCENMAFPLLLQMLQGTMFLPAYFRLLGCKIGHNVYMETTEITEFDLVRIDDNASLNYGCTIQTHLFEDRVMKMSKLHIGKNTTVGPMSVVLYDSLMKNGAVLDGLSLLMKGETLPSSSSWFGIPARSQASIGN